MYGIIVAALTGFEPATSTVTVWRALRCSTRLYYKTQFLAYLTDKCLKGDICCLRLFNGSAGWIRTSDLQVMGLVS